MKSTILETKNINEKEKLHHKSVDKKLLLLISVLLAFGTVMVFSASFPYASSHYGDGYYYLKRQGIFLIIGILCMILTSKLPIEFYRKITPVFYFICIALLILVLIGGFSEGLAKRWLGIPGTPLSFQPSELMKLGIILMLSWWIDKTNEAKKTFINEIVIPGIILFGACALVLLEKHLSGTIILVLIGVAILFIGGTSIKKMLIAYGSAGIVGAVAFLLTNEYAMKRIESFLNPNADILSDKWQTTQGLYAIGSGGLWGKGIGNSIQKYSYVSEPQNDFIFTICCEELGYIGAIVIIALFLILVMSGFRLAWKSEKLFDSLVAFGITVQIGIQAFLNMLVVSDLIPNTGISLPFFSYGGSSLVILLTEMGILLSISRKARC
ncbi:MAG: putative lipid II flippase FtsW [Ruminococcaceae bacterium]|nr:putative lipid II flippase FtsW [Oscillospiraceae bacterium]